MLTSNQFKFSHLFYIGNYLFTGNGGVANVRPQGIAVTNDKGLAVASPQATAIAGDFNLDEFKKKRVQLRRLRKIRKL
jgi:hypothetical protein